jgi:hypothetical protein
MPRGEPATQFTAPAAPARTPRSAAASVASHATHETAEGTSGRTRRATPIGAKSGLAASASITCRPTKPVAPITTIFAASWRRGHNKSAPFGLSVT